MNSRWIGTAALGALGVHAVPAATTLRTVRRVTPTLAGVGSSQHVALTFDDGPDPVSTPLVMDVLARHRVRATFFMLGSMVEAARDLTADLVAAGHEVGVHGFEHRNLLLRTPRSTYDDIARARDVIEDASGTAVRFYRPPYGVLSGPAWYAARRLGMRPVLWTAWGRDWEAEATGETVLHEIRRDLRGGGTVLLHDSDCTSAVGSWRSAVAALDPLLDECRARGWRVGPLAEHWSARASLRAVA